MPRSRNLRLWPILFVFILPIRCHLEDGMDVSGDGGVDPELPMTVTFIDVGQGDSALFELPGGEVVLVDGAEEGHGIGDVVPLLEDKGISVIDLLIVSHPHSDHIGGLDEVMTYVAVESIWENGEAGDSLSYDKYVEARNLSGALVEIPPKGFSHQIGTVNLEVLSTNEGYPDLNNDSLVVMFTHGNVRILMTGDVEQEAQADLVSDFGSSLGVDVIKVPHHCSFNLEPMFVSYTSPTTAVVSSGIGNDYGHPHQECLDQYLGVGADVWRTDQDGNIVVTSDENTVTVD